MPENNVTRANPAQFVRESVRAREPYIVQSYPGITSKLNQNESPFDMPAELKQAVIERIENEAWNRYPSEFGDRLRGVLAEQLDHPEEGIMVGNGSNELSYHLGLCCIEPGAPVVLPTPMFSLYQKIVRLYDGQLIEVGSADGLRYDIEALIASIRRNEPRLVVVTTPSNPTAQALSLDALDEIAAATQHGVFVVDEAYIEFSSTETALALVDEYPHVVVMRTFSKAYGLASLRIGYLLGAPSLIQELYKARLPFMLDPLAESAACELLTNRDIVHERIEEILSERDWLHSQLDRLTDVQVYPSETNFLIFTTPLSAGDVVQLMGEAGVAVRDVSGYPGMSGCVRVNAGTRSENKEFLTTLKSLLANNRGSPGS